MEPQRIVILGNGIAGTTAARHIRKRSDARIQIVSAETDHFFSRTALMYIYMGHMRFEDTKPYEDRFWDENRLELVRGYVERVDSVGRRLELRGGETIPYDTLILACGSKSRFFGWPGQDLRGVQGLYSYPDLERMERDTDGVSRAVIVGGGLIGIEMAEMLRTRGIDVTFLVREPTWMANGFPPEESAMIGEHIVEHGVDLRLQTELDSILPDGDGRVRAIVTKSGEEIPCQFVGLTIGVTPNIDFLDGSPIETDRGVLVDRFLRTNVENVYSIGDCTQLREPATGRRPIEAVWYAGRRMGETVARTITGNETAYDQGIWFNSAKFFDIEWQVYGNVPARLPEDEATLVWQHPNDHRLIRIQYGRKDQVVRGFNVMGIRYRHETCERWIAERRPLPYVLANLGEAAFDPELYEEFEQEVVRTYNDLHPEKPVKLLRRRGLLERLAGAIGGGR